MSYAIYTYYKIKSLKRSMFIFLFSKSLKCRFLFSNIVWHCVSILYYELLISMKRRISFVIAIITQLYWLELQKVHQRCHCKYAQSCHKCDDASFHWGCVTPMKGCVITPARRTLLKK